MHAPLSGAARHRTRNTPLPVLRSSPCLIDPANRVFAGFIPDRPPAAPPAPAAAAPAGPAPAPPASPIVPGDMISRGLSIDPIVDPASTRIALIGSIPSQLTSANVPSRIGVRPIPRLMRKNGITGERRSENRNHAPSRCDAAVDPPQPRAEPPPHPVAQDVPAVEERQRPPRPSRPRLHTAVPSQKSNSAPPRSDRKNETGSDSAVCRRRRGRTATGSAACAARASVPPLVEVRLDRLPRQVLVVPQRVERDHQGQRPGDDADARPEAAAGRPASSRRSPTSGLGCSMTLTPPILVTRSLS